MKEKSIINQVKTLLGMEVNLETMTLENGTVLEAEAFEAGNEVFIVNEEDKIAVPVGEYELPEGKILVVSEEGIIAEIKDAEVAEEAPVAEEEMEAAEEIAPEVIAEEVVVAIEEVETQIVSQVADIINEATPNEVTPKDSVTIAEDVIAEIISVDGAIKSKS
jgi:hypothetical protein